MKIAVVILNWNGKALLEQFLPSVTKFSSEATVYVADNASTDDSVAFVKKNYPEVKIIQNKINGGFAKGYNDALEHVSEDIFVLLNSDVEVTAGWLIPFKDEFLSNPETAALQPKILDFRKKEYFEYAGAAGGYVDLFGYPYCRGRIFETLEKDEGQYDEQCEIFWASGACLAIRKEVFFKAGKFDEDFFAHQEEIDLCWRIFNLDLKVKIAPGSTVYHLGGATLDKMHPRKTFFNFRNSLFCLLKNAPGNKAGVIIFSRLLLDAVAGFKFLIEGKWRHFAAILKAHFSFYAHFKKMLKKRKSFKKKIKYYGKTSVVASYYISGKRRFSEF
ncbi:glycosyltransferase family 2 protein [Salinimicrobium sp. GXAS 041]|uniref:glycosyltransferase family 2 protein n=1 Tax=Salinimicrobium sp. GXAS 041 TaxID=3400806 RepID=UPI003C712228